MSTRPLLVRYQREWLSDGARLKLLVKSRRIGGSFITALESASRAAGLEWGPRGLENYDPTLGVDQNIVSASHAQAMDLLEEAGRHLFALEEVLGMPLLEGEPSRTRITLKNGHRLVALAANPRTIRGAKGDLTLDEFGVMPFSRAIWRAAKPLTDPTLGRRKGYRLRVCGTPLGDDNMFYALACTDEGKRFSRHTVDIHRAVRDGFPADVDALREEAGDLDSFAQEYECQFLSALTRYISADLYERNCYDDGDRPAAAGYGYAGMDVARKATGDLSAIVELKRIATTLWHESTEARRGVPWAEQERWVDEVLSRCQRMAVDATSIGSQFAERLVFKHGARIEPVEFTTKSKEMLATGTKLALEKGELRPRRDDVELKRDVLSVRREMTDSSKVRYDAPRTKAGHGDRAWALMLAVHAAGKPVSDFVGRGTGRGSAAQSLSKIL